MVQISTLAFPVPLRQTAKQLAKAFVR